MAAENRGGSSENHAWSLRNGQDDGYKLRRRQHNKRWRNHHEGTRRAAPSGEDCSWKLPKAQDNEVGDGTTTAVILAGELLAKAETLLDKNVHPIVIIEGYKKAAEKAQEILDKIAIPVKFNDDKTLQEVATTSLSTKESRVPRSFSLSSR